MLQNVKNQKKLSPSKTKFTGYFLSGCVDVCRIGELLITCGQLLTIYFGLHTHNAIHYTSVSIS